MTFLNHCQFSHFRGKLTISKGHDKDREVIYFLGTNYLSGEAFKKVVSGTRQVAQFGYPPGSVTLPQHKSVKTKQK